MRLVRTDRRDRYEWQWDIGDGRKSQTFPGEREAIDSRIAGSLVFVDTYQHEETGCICQSAEPPSNHHYKIAAAAGK